MQVVDWDLISSYAGLLSLAGVSIFTGAFASLPNSSAKTKVSSQQSLLYAGEDEDEDEDIPDRVSSSDAWMFPIVGSVALFSLYMIVKYFGRDWINWLLGWYFSLAGALSVWKSAVSFARFLIGKDRWHQFDRNRIMILKGPREIMSLSLRTPTLLLMPVGLLPSLLYSQSTVGRKSALLTDILALSFSQNALAVLRIDSFQTGCILLSGLFFYDIYWVFGTDVMVKVATSLDVPIKLLWPKSRLFETQRGFTMLGLGDVVVPGMFIALALRYDYTRSQKANVPFTKPYFFITWTAYMMGLIVTMTVMHTLGKAQPALLYLSPACILSFFATALIRGELRDALRWTDDPGHQVEKKGAGKNLGASAASHEVRKENSGSPTPNGGANGHVNNSTDPSGEGGGEGKVEHESEEGRAKKTRSKGRKQA
ncbi:signal peptide peptidase-domain-containing protein [Phlebopus sp. FC_14]|nr:signal peptide peptidase-domain-containing protein [Phlebopus sp. FC_14]